MQIAMIGAGYVGLTTGACLAALGHHVVIVDTDAARIARLRGGDIPIFEPGLAELVATQTDGGRLAFTDSTTTAVADVDAVFLAVGTPSRSDGAIDLSFVDAAARSVAAAMRSDTVVVVKSTVVAGTARRLRDIIAEARGGLDFSVASNPEFLREGDAIGDFLAPDRIVIGADDPRAAAILQRIYAPLIDRGVPAVVTGTVNAELIKYAANALLALKIGFINEMADLCEVIGGDVRAVAQGIGLDKRIGSAFLAAGPGFGGSCFPKDTRALAALGRQRDVPLHLVEVLVAGNESRKSALAARILDALQRPPRGARIAILGVAFKANTDDVRESAALSIVPTLLAAGCDVHVHDVQADPACLPSATWHSTPLSAVTGADITIILTEWSLYASLDLAEMKARMRGDVLFDTRNIVDPDAAQAAGLAYLAVGRAAPQPAARITAPRRAGPSRVAAINS